MKENGKRNHHMKTYAVMIGLCCFLSGCQPIVYTNDQTDIGPVMEQSKDVPDLLPEQPEYSPVEMEKAETDGSDCPQAESDTEIEVLVDDNTEFVSEDTETFEDHDSDQEMAKEVGSSTDEEFESSQDDCSEAAATPTESMENGYYADAYAQQVLAIVNVKRVEAGLAELTMNEALCMVSRVRAIEITQVFSHTRPDGSSCFTAFDEAGICYWSGGENLAAGQTSPETVVQEWMDSPGHYENIMDGNFTQIGIACYYLPDSIYGYYWVEIFTD